MHLSSPAPAPAAKVFFRRQGARLHEVLHRRQPVAAENTAVPLKPPQAVRCGMRVLGRLLLVCGWVCAGASGGARPCAHVHAAGEKCALLAPLSTPLARNTSARCQARLACAMHIHAENPKYPPSTCWQSRLDAACAYAVRLSCRPLHLNATTVDSDLSGRLQPQSRECVRQVCI